MTKQLLKNSKFNPLTEEEWNKFFSLVDFSNVSKEEENQIRKMFRDSAKKAPLTRQLIREQNAVFSISLTSDDVKTLREADALGLGGDGCITWRKDLLTGNEIPSTVIHEMRHIQQQKENLWLTENVKEASITANKLSEAECACISSEYDGINMPIFNKLKNIYTINLNQTIKESQIPYAEGLSPEEKGQARTLYIQEQATQKALGETIALMMQENGAKTMEFASELDIRLTTEDVVILEEWRDYYKKQAMKQSESNEKIDDVGINEDEQKEIERVQNIMIKKYPVLKKRPFFKTGFTPEEALLTDTLNVSTPSTYVKYFSGSQNIQSEKKYDIQKAAYIERVYKNDSKHSLLYKSETRFDGKENKEIYYDANGKPMIIRQYKNGYLNKEEKIVYSDILESNKYRNGKKVEQTKESIGSDKFKSKTVQVNSKNASQKKITTFNPPLKDGTRTYSEEKIGDFKHCKKEYTNGTSVSWYSNAAGKKVGQYMYKDKTGKKNYKYFTGDKIQDKKTGKFIPQELKHYSPKQLKLIGYESAKSNKDYGDIIDVYKQKRELTHINNKYFYLKNKGNGKYDIVCLNEAYIGEAKGQILAYTDKEGEPNVIEQGLWIDLNSKEDIIGTTIYADDGTILEQFKKDEETLKITENTRLVKGYYETESYNAKGKVIGFDKEDATTYETIQGTHLHKTGSVKSITVGDETQIFTYDGKMSGLKKSNHSYIFYTEGENPSKIRFKIVHKTDTQGNYAGVTTTCYRKNGSISSFTDTNADGKGTKICYHTDGKTKRAEGSGYYKDEEFIKNGEWTYYTPRGEQKRIYIDGVAQKNKQNKKSPLQQISKNNVPVNPDDISQKESSDESSLLKNLSKNAEKISKGTNKQQQISRALSDTKNTTL